MVRFLLNCNFIVGQDCELSAEQSHHLARVLRMQVGEPCELIDGKGTVATALIEDNHPKRSRCVIKEVRKETLKNRVHIAFSIPKSNALDFIIHRCTEIGVRSFQPLVSDHSQKINSWNHGRWERVVVETAKQCQETFFPEIFPPIDLKKWIFEKRHQERQLIYCDEEARFDALDSLLVDQEVDLVIGSEGGWSEAERQWFQKVGRGMGLGKNRLRAETACVVALTLLKKQGSEL